MLNGLRVLGSVFTFVGLGATAVPLDVARVVSDAAPRAATCIPADQCCKVCSKGKACGNTCIRRSYECHVGRGCACNADEVCE
jgi:hypothetical protein